MMMHPQHAGLLPRQTLDVGGIEAQVVAQWGTGYIVAVPAGSDQPVINSSWITPVAMPQMSSGCTSQVGVASYTGCPLQVGSSHCGSCGSSQGCSCGSNAHAAAANAADCPKSNAYAAAANAADCPKGRRGRWADLPHEEEDDDDLSNTGSVPSATHKAASPPPQPMPELYKPPGARAHGASFKFPAKTPSVPTPEEARRNVDLPQGAKVFVHDSDGICRPLPAKKNGGQQVFVHESDGVCRPLPAKKNGGQAASLDFILPAKKNGMQAPSSGKTTPPISKEKGAKGAAKIFVHDSDGSLHHVAECSKGKTGFEVDMNDQYNCKQENARAFEDIPPPPPQKYDGGIHGDWQHQQQHVRRHASPGSSEESTTAESLPSPSQSGAESGGLTPTPGPCRTSRSDGFGAASASHAGYRAGASASRQAPSASSFFAAKARLSAERPDWMKGKAAETRSPAVPSYGAAPPLPPPPPPPPFEDEPSEVASSSVPGGEASKDKQKADASEKEGAWDRKVGKRTGRGRNKGNWCDTTDSPRDCVESMPSAPAAPALAPALPVTPETSETSPEVPMPTQRRGRKGPAEQATSKAAGAQLRRPRKAGVWKQVNQKVSYVRSYLRSCLKSCTVRTKACAKILRRHASSLALVSSVVFLLFSLVFYFSRVGTNQTGNVSMQRRTIGTSNHAWPTSFPVAEIRDRRIGSLQKHLDMESARALAALRSAKQTKQTRPQGRSGASTSKAQRKASKVSARTASPKDRSEVLTPMEKRERYEAAATAWNSWATDWHEMAAGQDIDKMTDEEYEQYITSVRGSSESAKAHDAYYAKWEQMVRDERERFGSKTVGSKSSRMATKQEFMNEMASRLGDDSSMAGLDEMYGADMQGYADSGMSDKFASMAERASMDERLAFLMYLQNRYESSGRGFQPGDESPYSDPRYGYADRYGSQSR